MKSVGLIGLGRFGKVLVNILQKGFEIKVYDKNLPTEFSNVKLVDLKTVLKEKVIFIAVPIGQFESVIKEIVPFLQSGQPGQTIIDVCSVKMHPVKVMTTHLPPEVGIIASHPLFGPDSFTNYSSQHSSSKSNNPNSLKMMLYPIRDTYQEFQNWKKFFQDQEIDIVEIDPETHDRLAAETQGLTHYLGRILKEFGVKKTIIDTQGFKELLKLVEQTCNDSWELYLDLQRYNSYTPSMMKKITTSIEKLNKESKIS